MFSKDSYINLDQGDEIKKYLKYFVGILIVIWIFKSGFFYTVKYGEAAVLTRFGKIVTVSYPGLHAKFPLVDSVDKFTTQKLIYETSDSPGTSDADYTDLPVDTSTLDGQQVSIRYTLRFRLKSDKIADIARNIGKENQVVEKVVKAESRSVARNIAREFEAQSLYTGDIFEYQKKVYESLKPKFEDNGIEIDEFLVRHIKFSEQYVSAVEQKQIENEKVKAEEYKAEQEKFKKEQQITRAEGESRAQEILRRTIDPLVLEKMAIEKWDGKLPAYIGGGEVPFINVK